MILGLQSIESGNCAVLRVADSCDTCQAVLSENSELLMVSGLKPDFMHVTENILLD